MKLLKNVCIRHGVSAMVIIHQPSGHVFDTFDRLILMSGGRCLYSDAMQNLSDWYTNAWNEEKPQSSHEVPLDLMQKLKDPPESVFQLFASTATELVPSAKVNNQWHRNSIAAGIKKADTRKASNWRKFQIVFYRNLVNNYVRDYTNLAARIASYAAVAGLNAALFWQTGSQENSMDFMIGAAMFNVMAFYLLPFPVIPVQVHDKKFFLAERNLGFYSPWIYIVAQVLLELWVLILLAIIVAVIEIPSVGFWNPSQPRWATFFSILSYMMASGLVGSALTQFFAILAPSQDLAYTACAAVVTFNMGLSGAFVPFPYMRDFIRWAQWISPCKYSLQALLISYSMDTSREAALEVLDLNTPHTVLQNILVLAFIFALHTVSSTVLLTFQREYS
jgi:hypothetical protein